MVFICIYIFRFNKIIRDGFFKYWCYSGFYVGIFSVGYLGDINYFMGNRVKSVFF